MITGHTADNLSPEVEEIRWKSYAKLDETFVFLMGLKSIDMITEKLMRYGKLSDTPVAVIHGENTDGTYVKLVGTLSDIAKKGERSRLPITSYYSCWRGCVTGIDGLAELKMR